MEPKIEQLCPTCLSSARKLGQLGPDEAGGDFMQVFSIVIAIQTLVSITPIFYNTVISQFLTTGAETEDLQRSTRV